MVDAVGKYVLKARGKGRDSREICDGGRRKEESEREDGDIVP